MESHSNTKLRDPDYLLSDPEYDSKNLAFLHERLKSAYVSVCKILVHFLFSNSRPIHESVTKKKKKKKKSDL